MIILRRISTAITVGDCIGIYTDPDNIRALVAKTYEGICFAGCYILKIERLIYVGECEINRDGAPNVGTIPVTFEAQAVVYLPGEIINGCVVKKHTGDLLLCSTNIASIMVTKHPLTGSITQGQIISVRVEYVRYPIRSPNITASASIYLPMKNATTYQLDPLTITSGGLLVPDVVAYLGGVLGRIQAEKEALEAHKKVNKDGVKFFTQLLYAYTAEVKPPNKHNLMEMLESGLKPDIKYLCRDKRLDLVEPLVCGYDTLPADTVADSTLPAQDVLLALLEDYCMYLRTVREMLDSYNTEALVLSHKNLWQIFKKSKV